MFRFLAGRTKKSRRVYLGNVTIVPDTGTSSDPSRWSISIVPEDYDGVINDVMRDLIALPPVSSRSSGQDGDLALDVTLVDADPGFAALAELTVIAVPIFRRPKVTLTARLYVIDTGEAFHAVTVHRTLKWLSCLKKTMNPLILFQIRAGFSADEMGLLVGQALVDLISKCRDQV